jgi:hypothetical protein
MADVRVTKQIDFSKKVFEEGEKQQQGRNW